MQTNGTEIADWAVETVRKLATELSAGLGPGLRAVVVSGDATEGAGGVISLLVVTDRVNGATLEAVGTAMAKAKAGPVEPPLVLTEEEIRRSLDAWPVELLSIAVTGKVVAGSLDLASLGVDREKLRLQCERELRGLVIHCRFAYLAHRRDESRLGELVAGGAARFVVLARATLHLDGTSAAGDSLGVLERLSQWLPQGDGGTTGDPLAAAWSLRREKRPKWSSARLLELAALLERWVDAVDRLDTATGGR